MKTFDNTTQAEIAKSILDSAGIFFVLHGEHMSAINTPKLLAVRFMVRAEDSDDAIAVIEGRYRFECP
ncbi:MAG: DUF2007 domain-containing protein, partial [Alistipes sp.]|nr:DUF2007 domain-containing protein [Alistipes sp.]